MFDGIEQKSGRGGVSGKGVRMRGVHDDHVVTSNILWMFDGEILRNGQIIADFKL